MKKITAALIIIAVAFGMVGCEKEPEAPKVNIKRSTTKELEAAMTNNSMSALLPAAEVNKKNQQQGGNKKESN